jgi:hypothetical protein
MNNKRKRKKKKRTASTTNVGENAGVGGRKEPSYTAGGNAS